MFKKNMRAKIINNAYLFKKMTYKLIIRII